MKNQIQKVFAILFATSMLYSCTKSASDTTPDNSAAAASSSVANGSWRISSYTERGENKTDDFAGVSFVFNSGGTLTVSGTQTATGTWSASGNTFVINLGSADPLRRLTEPWKIIESTSTTLRLDHPEADEDEHLTFSKQ